MRAGRGAYPMHGLVDLDVTVARSRCRAVEPHASFTAFVVACVARAAAAHPEVHAYRDWRGRLVLSRHVDVATIVEVPRPDGPFPLAHTIRDADVRSVGDISAELRRVKADPARSRAGRWMRLAPVLARVPGVDRLVYRLLFRSVRLRSVSGTVSVTSVGMFGGGGGFGIAVQSLIALLVVVGGVSTRPRVVAGRIEPREVLDLTVSVDHAVVDGAPAARFFADLRRLIESGELLSA
jgi:pyruvate/2-oxoglutarate dehydrogenase complex dihydrolipoamide acyltransferase (E2) component